MKVTGASRGGSGAGQARRILSAPSYVGGVGPACVPPPVSLSRTLRAAARSPSGLLDSEPPRGRFYGGKEAAGRLPTTSGPLRWNSRRLAGPRLRGWLPERS